MQKSRWGPISNIYFISTRDISPNEIILQFGEFEFSNLGWSIFL